jgi:hypothetical protein
VGREGTLTNVVLLAAAATAACILLLIVVPRRRGAKPVDAALFVRHFVCARITKKTIMLFFFVQKLVKCSSSLPPRPLSLLAPMP